MDIFYLISGDFSHEKSHQYVRAEQPPVLTGIVAITALIILYLA